MLTDECDALLSSRSQNTTNANEDDLKVKNLLLQEMDPDDVKNNGLTFICTTNRPGSIDSAFTSRWTAQFAFELPNTEEREALLWKFLQDEKHSLISSHIKYCAHLCEGFTGRDINRVIKNTKFWPSRKLLQSRYFSQVPNMYYCLSMDCDKYHPCSENYVGAEEKDIKIIKKDVCQPMISPADLIFEIRSTPCTATHDDLQNIKKYEQQLKLNMHCKQRKMSVARSGAIENLEKLEFLWKMNSILTFTSHQSKMKRIVKKFKYKNFQISSAGLAKTIIEKEAKKGDTSALASMIVRCLEDFEETERYFHSEIDYLRCQLDVDDYIEKICKDKLNSFDVEF